MNKAKVDIGQLYHYKNKEAKIDFYDYISKIEKAGCYSRYKYIAFFKNYIGYNMILDENLIPINYNGKLITKNRTCSICEINAN